MLEASLRERERRNEVMRRILDHVKRDQRVTLPAFDPALDRPSDQFALLSIGLEPNDFSGSLDVYRYQFEGEEDLLHLIVTRYDQAAFPTEEAQAVAGFVLDGVPSALIWLRPGEFSHHFYFGHDELPTHLIVD